MQFQHRNKYVIPAKGEKKSRDVIFILSHPGFTFVRLLKNTSIINIMDTWYLPICEVLYSVTRNSTSKDANTLQ